MYLLSDSMGRVCEIVPVLASYCYVHEFNEIFGCKVRSYHGCSGCRSCDGQDGFLDHPRACFF
jgi:hypothetical protein